MSHKLKSGDKLLIPPVDIATFASTTMTPEWAKFFEGVKPWTAQATKVLTPQDWFVATEAMGKQRYRPPVLFVSKAQKDLLDYLAATTCVWTLPGARRWRGPDGKTWIEKLWKTAKEGYGSMNRAKRRMGLVPVQKYLRDVEWVRPEEANG